MGRLTAVCVAMTFVAGVATVRLAGPSWTSALYVTLVLACFTLLSVLGWLGGGVRGVAAAGVPPGRALPAVAGAVLLGLSLLRGTLPGLIPYSERATIDLPRWFFSAAGLAGLLATVSFGLLLALLGGSRRAQILGLGFFTAGLLGAQPSLRAAGFPHLGPLGALMAVSALVAGAVLLGGRRDQ